MAILKAQVTEIYLYYDFNAPEIWLTTIYYSGEKFSLRP